jgi:predicted transposase/invertase (TIGR01784 family)
LDLAVRDGNHLLNLEVQLASLQRMADRMIFNSSRLLSVNTASGTKYEDMPKTTVISILNFPYRDNHPDYHQPFGLFYEKEPERVTDKFDYHMLEMPKFRKFKPDITDPLHRWLFYLDSGYLEPDSPVIKEALQMDQGLYQFAQQYQRNVSDPRTLDAYYGYMMECMDEQERIDTAKAEGEAVGESRRNTEIAKNALGMGMSIEDIIRLTRLSKHEIEAIKKTI